jgi:uncharacterized membrane protein YgcG
MKRVWTEISRAAEVRDAARSWAKAKAIDSPTLAAIEAAYPDPRVSLHPFWRVLVFVAACVAIIALYFGIFQNQLGGPGPAAAAAAALAVATEVLRGSRVSGTGADAASSFLAWMFAVMAANDLFDHEWRVGDDTSLDLVLAFSFVLAALFAWRWGFWAFGAVSAASAFLFAARLPAGRAIWVVLSLALLAGIDRLRDRASLAPPHRRSLVAVFVVSAAALYAAVNLYALDQFWIEAIRVVFRRPPAPPPPPTVLRLLAMLATAAFPIVFLLWGIRARRVLLLAIAIVSGALSVATFRHYVPIGPEWAYLTACGSILIVAALWTHRRLRDAAGGAWRGLTAAPLHSSDSGGVSPLGALGAHVALSAAPTEPEHPGFTGGGGSFGGGGASGKY